MEPRLFSFVGGETGLWRVERIETVFGEPWPVAPRLDVLTGTEVPADGGAAWVLRGITSNARYVQREEKNSLQERQEGLGRESSTLAALIPIRKNAEWWALTQDERREVFEEQSKHIKVGLQYLPAVARKLHHCRDLSENEPFDFLTWFEYAPEHEDDFNRMLVELRVSPEWNYVEREVDIRLKRP